MLCVLTLLLAPTAASAAPAAATSTVATARLSTALAFGLWRVSVCTRGRLSGRGGSTVADLRLLHECLFGSRGITRTILRRALRHLIGLAIKIGRAGLFVVLTA